MLIALEYRISTFLIYFVTRGLYILEIESIEVLGLITGLCPF